LPYLHFPNEISPAGSFSSKAIAVLGDSSDNSLINRFVLLSIEKTSFKI
jgi:hypothetical protein